MAEYLNRIFLFISLFGYLVFFIESQYLTWFYIEKRIAVWINKNSKYVYPWISSQEVMIEHPTATKIFLGGTIIMAIGMIGTYFV